MAEFGVQGICDLCGELRPLTKYKNRWYCRLCLIEKKEQEAEKIIRKKRKKVRNDFERWNQT